MVDELFAHATMTFPWAISRASISLGNTKGKRKPQQKNQ
jgi:hypothetical protein